MMRDAHRFFRGQTVQLSVVYAAIFPVSYNNVLTLAKNIAATLPYPNE